MYCLSCGGTIAHGLNYCNHCGQKLNVANDDNLIGSPVKPELLVSSMVALFIFGLGAIAVLIGVMRQVVGFDLNLILVVLVLSFLLLSLVEAVLARLLFKSKRSVEEDGEKTSKEHKTFELGEAQAQMLAEPMPSVTEHTTRKIGPIYSERK